MRKLPTILAAMTSIVAATLAAPVLAAETPTLVYDADSRAPSPIPLAERGLQTITAEPWYKVSDKGLQLEGASFDREGNLDFVEVFGGSVMRLTPDMKLTTIMPKNDRASAGLGTQVSPHFHARPNAPEKVAFWRRSSWYRSMSGRSRCSGMFGMRS